MAENSFVKTAHEFIKSACKHQVRMLMVGGTAVNYYGYKRHSDDIDFWIELSETNLNKLKNALNDLGYIIEKFPEKVLKGEQNISIKISPDLEIELITRFNPGKEFNEAFTKSKVIEHQGNPEIKWHVISLEDLITSKAKSLRKKDILDIQELRRINPER